MANMYFNLVIGKRRTCNPENTNVPQVPEKYRAEVLAMLTAAGRDADGELV